MSFLKYLRTSQKISERDLAKRVAIARDTLRTYEDDYSACRIGSLERIAAAFNFNTLVAMVPNELTNSDLSTVAISQAICRDGFESWKLHIFNLVDHFREALDYRLLLLPPVSSLNRNLTALLASTVHSLAMDAGLPPPDWVLSDHYLERPWFVTQMESLKASALLESPLAFRRNNIFVLENFLDRA